MLQLDKKPSIADNTCISTGKNLANHAFEANCLVCVLQYKMHAMMKHVVAKGEPEWQACKASHCGRKQQQRSHTMVILFLLV